MAVSIRQIHPRFVGEVAGADPTCPLGAGSSAAIEAVADRCAAPVSHDSAA